MGCTVSGASGSVMVITAKKKNVKVNISTGDQNINLVWKKLRFTWRRRSRTGAETLHRWPLGQWHHQRRPAALPIVGRGRRADHRRYSGRCRPGICTIRNARAHTHTHTYSDPTRDIRDSILVVVTVSGNDGWCTKNEKKRRKFYTKRIEKHFKY